MYQSTIKYLFRTVVATSTKNQYLDLKTSIDNVTFAQIEGLVIFHPTQPPQKSTYTALGQHGIQHLSIKFRQNFLQIKHRHAIGLFI
jgi:hypothetical protein